MSEFTVNIGQLKRMIKLTLPCVAKKVGTGNSHLRHDKYGGIWLEPKGGTISITATDAKRLVTLDGWCRTSGSVTEFVVPAKSARAVKGFISQFPNTDDVTIGNDLTTKTCYVRHGEEALTVETLGEIKFPNYREPLRAPITRICTANAGKFKAAVRAFLDQEDGEDEHHAFSLECKAGTLFVGTTGGKNIAKLQIDSYEDLSINLSAKYVIEMARLFPDKAVLEIGAADIGGSKNALAVAVHESLFGGVPYRYLQMNVDVSKVK